MAEVDRSTPHAGGLYDDVRDPDPRLGVIAIRHDLRRVVTRHPSIFLPVARRKHRQSTLGPGIDVVIDGFTRSAGTFAVVAFQVAQNGHVRVAHHLHAAAHLKAAVRAGVPALIPIRPPRGTVLSAAIREPQVGLERWLRSYRDFYLQIAPLADAVVFAHFDTVTTDLGAVIRHVNARFGTSFVEFSPSSDDLELVFRLIDERAARPSWQWMLGEFLAGRVSLNEYMERTAEERASTPMLEIPEARVQRPSPARAAMSSRLAAKYEEPSLARSRRRAEEAYAAVARSAC